MTIDLLDNERYIKDYELKEVKSSNLYNIRTGIPDDEGLASLSIFGEFGSEDRRKRFGYITLNDYFFNPHVFIVIVSMKRVVRDIVMDGGNWYIKEGEFYKLGAGEQPPALLPAGSGISFIRENWDKINWAKTDMAEGRKEKIKFLKQLKLDDIFVTKWLVIPPFFRDVDLQSGKKNDINIMYRKLLSLASLVKNTKSLFVAGGQTDAHAKLQQTLVDLYNYFVEFVSGVHGFIHEHVMGKSTDYSARTVISTANLNAERPEDMEVSFSHSSVPMHLILKSFAPFVMREFKGYVLDKLQGNKFVHFVRTSGEVERIPLADHFTEDLMSEAILKLIELYYESKEHRLDAFTLLAADGRRVPFMYYMEDGTFLQGNVEGGAKKARAMTLCELFYIVIMRSVIPNKYVYITRYPIEDYNNIYPTKINIIPYSRFGKHTIDGVVYPRFPEIKLPDDMKHVDTLFVDTLRLFPTYLSALGGDFDGDTCSITPVFANYEADKHIFSKVNVISIAGDTMRTWSTENVIHSLYFLTRKNKIIA
jgi:hypothetical protein